jgi:polyisoprenoid-binding protein YceI
VDALHDDDDRAMFSGSHEIFPRRWHSQRSRRHRRKPSRRRTGKIDPARTHIAFAIDAVGFPRTQGEFRRFEGRISVDFEHPGRSSVAFHVQSQSVDVGSSSFDDYLRSVAFLNAARYPTIDFVSNSVEKIDDHTVRVSGDLTLLGVTKPLTVNVAVRREFGSGSSRLGFLAKTSINRLDFGMTSGFPLVSRDVELVISSEAAEL